MTVDEIEPTNFTIALPEAWNQQSILVLMLPLNEVVPPVANQPQPELFVLRAKNHRCREKVKMLSYQGEVRRKQFRTVGRDPRRALYPGTARHAR